MEHTCVRGWFSSCCQPWGSYRSVWTDPTVEMFPGPCQIKTNAQKVSFVQPVYIPNHTLNVLRNPLDKESHWWRAAMVLGQQYATHWQRRVEAKEELMSWWKGGFYIFPVGFGCNMRSQQNCKKNIQLKGTTKRCRLQFGHRFEKDKSQKPWL